MAKGFSDAEIEQIADLLRQGGTASSIGVALGRSRNSIVGVIFRRPSLKQIGFARPPTSMYWRSRKGQKILKIERVREREHMTPEQIKVVEELPHVDWAGAPQRMLDKLNEPVPALPVPVEGVQMGDLREVHCRWPLWGNEVVPIDVKRFCGQTKARGSYCAKHARLSYAAVGTR